MLPTLGELFKNTGYCDNAVQHGDGVGVGVGVGVKRGLELMDTLLIYFHAAVVADDVIEGQLEAGKIRVLIY